tara:strand:- start:144 stop:794 length:651 start_codon:yes stop_codon:yes gene_type:complete
MDAPNGLTPKDIFYIMERFILVRWKYKSFFYVFFISAINKMSSLSLDASIRTCKVETGEATRIESDRFLNPHNMVCIPWNGTNSKGQAVCADSFYTKRRGCNSALDRVSVESALRPDYAAYINLNMAGLQGDIYGNQTAWDKSGSSNEWENSRNKLTGNFGGQFQATNYQTCGVNAYEQAMARTAQSNRGAQAANLGYQQNQYRQAGGVGSCGGGH